MAPVTRSRTGALPATSRKRTAEFDNEDLQSNVSSTTRRQRKPRKRTKVVHNSAEVRIPTSTVPQTPQEVGGLLKALLDMPFDVLEDIFMMRDPETLVGVLRTNKAFYRLLQSSTFNHMWREVFARQGIPEAPEGWSLAKWAVLLFGERCCQICMSAKVPEVSCGILKRVCKDCICNTMIDCEFYTHNGDLIPRELFENSMPTEKVYYRARDGWLSSAPFAYESDVKAFLADLDAARSESAQQEKDYIARRKEEFSSRLAHIQCLKKWQTGMSLIDIMRIEKARIEKARFDRKTEN